MSNESNETQESDEPYELPSGAWILSLLSDMLGAPIDETEESNAQQEQESEHDAS